MAPRAPASSPSPWLLLQTVAAALVDRPEHGPYPVRFRACGATVPWMQWLRQRLSADEVQELGECAVPPPRCADMVVRQVLDKLVPATPGIGSGEREVFAEEGGRHIAIALAFWQRKGSLIECTPALLEWLRHTDLTRELPARLLHLPFQALYFQGLPLQDGEAAGVEGVFVFEHTDPEEPQARALTLVPVCWSEHHKQVLPLESMTVTILEESTPLVDWIRQRVTGEWATLMEGIVKVLLYLGLKEARRQIQTPYRDAPRVFSGLGKRKRDLRLAQIERLYDRILVGPETLPNAGASSPGSHSVRPHWRRGHFRQQPHGRGGLERQLIFIAPLMVNADRMAADVPEPKAYRPTV